MVEVISLFKNKSGLWQTSLPLAKLTKQQKHAVLP
jgi:hypothetical protein